MVARMLMILRALDALEQCAGQAEFAGGVCEFNGLFDLQLNLHSLLRRRVVSS